MKDKLFIEEIIFKRELVEDFNIYPFNIELIKNFNKLDLNTPVTFLIEENGIGKSTFIEAIAVSCGLNPEGGTQTLCLAPKRLIHVYIII